MMKNKKNQKKMRTISKMSKSKFPKMLIDPPLHELIYDLDQNDYHAHTGSNSSSQLKDGLEDEEVFINKYIKKTIPREENAAFNVGTYFHTGVLEPKKLKAECAVFSGKVRRGDAWDKFKKKNEGKNIITRSQIEQGDRLIKAVEDSPVSMDFIKRGTPEVSLFVEIAIVSGEIYAPYFGMRLDPMLGWIKDIQKKSFFDKATKFIIKVRADSIDIEEFSFVLDLKSTSGNARSAREMQEKVKYYNYDLSAALYLDIFSLIAGFQMNTFIWTFASKDYHNCKSYRASDKNILVGRRKWMRGLLAIAETKRNNWQLYDSLGVLDAHYSELYYIAESDTDLL